MNLLFVCSRNQWRSPTGEAIYKNQSGLSVRSAGTEPSARIRLTEKMVQWADIIFVMEKKHKQRLLENFGNEIENQSVIVLDIPDEYKFMDPKRVEDLKTKIDHYLKE